MLYLLERCFADLVLDAFGHREDGIFQRNAKCKNCKNMQRRDEYKKHERGGLSRKKVQKEQKKEEGIEEDEIEEEDEEEKRGVVLSAKEATRRNVALKDSGSTPKSKWCTG
jgi:3-dehydroquinate dehydratase